MTKTTRIIVAAIVESLIYVACFLGSIYVFASAVAEVVT